MIRSTAVNAVVLLVGIGFVTLAVLGIIQQHRAAGPSEGSGAFLFFLALGAWCIGGASINFWNRRSPATAAEAPLKSDSFVKGNALVLLLSTLGTILAMVFERSSDIVFRSFGRVLVLSLVAVPVSLALHIAERAVRKWKNRDT